MFSNIIRRSFSKTPLSIKLENLWNQLNPNYQPALALAGGKALSAPQFNKNFIDYTNSAGTEDNATQRRYNKEMHEAAKKATEEINRRDEKSIEDRINTEREGKLGARDASFEKAQQAQKKAQAGTDQSALGARQWEKWAKQGHNDNERFYKQAKDSCQQKDQDWAKTPNK